MTFLPLLSFFSCGVKRGLSPAAGGAKAFGDLDLAIRHLPASPRARLTAQTVSRKRLTRWVTLIADPAAAATRTACRHKHCTLLVLPLYAAGLREPGHGLRHWTVTWGQPSGTRSHAGQRLNCLWSAVRSQGDGVPFVVQLDDATRLPFDFRIQAGEAQRSWAVPKGPSLDLAAPP